MLCEHRTPEAWFPIYVFLKTEENAQIVHLDLQHRTLHVWNSDCVSHWKIAGVVLVICNTFCICCCKPWTSLTPSA